MKFARFEINGWQSYAVVEGDQLLPLDRLDRGNLLLDCRLVPRIARLERPELSTEQPDGPCLGLGLLLFERSQRPLFHQIQLGLWQGRFPQNLPEQVQNLR